MTTPPRVSGRSRSSSTPAAPDHGDAQTTGATPRTPGALTSRPTSPTTGPARARSKSDPQFADAQLRLLRRANEGTPAASDAKARVESESALAETPHVDAPAATAEASSSRGHAVDVISDADIGRLLGERKESLLKAEQLSHQVDRERFRADAAETAEQKEATERALLARTLQARTQAYQDKLTARESEIARLQDSLRQTRQVLDGALQANGFMSRQLPGLRAHIAALTTEPVRAEATSSTSPEDIATLRDDLEHTRAALQRRGDELGAWMERHAELAEQLEATSHQLAQASDERTAKAAALAPVAGREDELASLRALLQDMERQLDETRDHAAQSQRELVTAKEGRQAADARIAQLTASKASLEETLDALKDNDAAPAVASARSTSKKKKAKAADANPSLTDLQADLAVAEATADSAGQREAIAVAKAAELQGKVAELQAKVAELSSTIDKERVAMKIARETLGLVNLDNERQQARAKFIADLEASIKDGDSSRLAVLMPQIPDMLAENEQQNFRRHQLMMAIVADQTEMVGTLVEHIDDLDAPIAAGSNPLTEAAHPGRTGAIRTLLAAGADPRKPDGTGQDAMFIAASTGNIEALRLLLDWAGRHLDQHELREWVNRPRPPTSSTALHAAARRGNLDIVDLLATHATLDATDNEGQTAFARAAARLDSEMANHLEDKGATVRFHGDDAQRVAAAIRQRAAADAKLLAALASAQLAGAAPFTAP